MPQVDVRMPSEDEDFDVTSKESVVKQPVEQRQNIHITDARDVMGAETADNAPSDPSEPLSPDNDMSSEEAVNPPAAKAAVPSREPLSPPEKPRIHTDAYVPSASVKPLEESPSPPAAVTSKPVFSLLGTSRRPAAESSQTAVLPVGSRRPAAIVRLIAELVLIIAVVALGLWAWSLKSDNAGLSKQVASLNANPQIVAQKQTQALIAAVGQLMQLPPSETPTVATVSDAAQAKKQSAFFNNAQNGDKVLMYVKAGEAILYRPSTNKIILVAPLTLNSSTPAASSSKTTSTGSSPTTSTTSR